jgi:predicted butyrate kinase (DUF1464 family)
MDEHKNQQSPHDQSRHERLKIILMAFLWLVFFALSFITYYAIPAVIFITWAVIAWVVKASKGDQGGGSGYDSEF